MLLISACFYLFVYFCTRFFYALIFFFFTCEVRSQGTFPLRKSSQSLQKQYLFP